MATAPRPGVTRRADAEKAHVTFVLEDVSYTVWPNEVSASLSGEFRRTVGMSFRAALDLMNSDPDLDILRGLMWLARRQAGETLTLDDVEDFTYDQAKSLTFDQVAPEEPDSPQP